MKSATSINWSSGVHLSLNGTSDLLASLLDVFHLLSIIRNRQLKAQREREAHSKRAERQLPMPADVLAMQEGLVELSGQERQSLQEEDDITSF